MPIIERELRGRARSRALYWTRFAVGLAGLIFCLPMTEFYGGMAFGPKAAGHSVFTGIVVAAFILSCCAGFLTVESISRERREGTLGLLYLTRVKAPDVLLGSFGAAGISCVCALLAFMPVVMLPVLTGGVTGGEAFRAMLALLDTLLLSLAAGLWASAGARGWFKSARALVGVLALVIGVSVFSSYDGFIPLFSPSFMLGRAWDADYRLNPESFWMSLAFVQGISWLLLIGAGFRLRRAMREGDGRLGEASLPGAKGGGFTLVSWKIRFPRMKETDDPVRWLVRRQRGIKTVIWAGAVIGMISGSGFIPLIFHWMGGGTASHIYSSAPIYMVTFFARGCLFGWAASRFFVEGRRGGELELLLTTPVGAKAVVSSQWKELKRLFAWPVIIMVVCANVPRVISLIPYYARNEMNGEWEIFVWLVVNQALSCLESILGVGALIWTGLWFGLRARSQAAALVQIVLVSQAAPYVGSIAGHLLMTLLASAGIPFLYSGGAGAYGSWQRDLSLCEVLLPSIAVLLYYVWLIRWARRRLAGDLRDDSPVGFSLAGLRAGLNSFVDRARNWPPAPER